MPKGKRLYVPVSSVTRKVAVTVTGGAHFVCCDLSQNWNETNWREVDEILCDTVGNIVGKEFTNHIFLWSFCSRCSKPLIHASTVDAWDRWSRMTPTQKLLHRIS